MFERQGWSKTGRIGKLTTRKGVLTTPFFMPDATRASVRGVSSRDLKTTGLEALVINTYHLYLQPGTDRMVRAGGAHSFMRWDGPLLSDSGGYQVYSLIHAHPEMGRITEDGAEFRSIFDGSKHLITPERAIAIQFDLGSDMMVCLDDPRPNDAPESETRAAVDRTLRWAKRCKEEYERQCTARGMDERSRPLLFGVVQGGLMVTERKRCAEELVSLGFDGYGFGGRHIDGSGQFLEKVLAETASFIPEDAPRFALGIGTPSDIARCHSLGWDMFDCVIPTREGRHGRLFVWEEREGGESDQHITTREGQIIPYSTLNIHNEQFADDRSPFDATCDCEACTDYTRSYVKHLFKVADPLAGRLASIHNLRFYTRLMHILRQKSVSGDDLKSP